MTIPSPLYTFAGSTAAVRQIILNSSATDKDAALAAAESLGAVSTALLAAVARGDGPEALTSAVDIQFSAVVRAVRDLLKSTLQAGLLDTLWTVNNSYVAAADALTGARFSGDLHMGLDPGLWGYSIGQPGSVA